MDISKCLKITNLDLDSSLPLYLQIANRLTEYIAAGDWPSGTKLPPERELASLFQVSRTTAINVYRHLEKEGLVATKVGSGTFVASNAAVKPATVVKVPWSQLFAPCLETSTSSIIKDMVSLAPSRQLISLAAGLPDPRYYPLSDFSTHLCATASEDMGHIATEGYAPLREAIAELLQEKSIATKAENILVTAGSQQGLYLLSKIFLEPGDYVIVESPTYIGAIQTFQAAGARLLKIPAADPFDLQLLEDYLIRYRPKLLYIMPTFQNPTGRTLQSHERQALLSLAARYRLIIVEDDPYGSLYIGDQQPPLPLKATDPYGGVIYVGTFSKILFPGLRTGWVAAPPEVIHRLALEKQYIDLHSNNIAQILLLQYLRNKKLPAHLAAMRSLYENRRNAMAKALRHYCSDTLSFGMPLGGFYFWCTLRSQESSQVLLREAMSKGVNFVPGEAFYQAPSPTNQLRLCFVTHDEELLVEGIKRLAAVFKRSPSKSQDTGIASSPLIPII